MFIMFGITIFHRSLGLDEGSPCDLQLPSNHASCIFSILHLIDNLDDKAVALPVQHLACYSWVETSVVWLFTPEMHLDYSIQLFAPR